MKIKHNCGTKTDRENLAKEICLAESRGEKNNVDVYLTFPPGYLEHYRDYIFKKDKSKVMWMIACFISILLTNVNV